MDDCVNAEYLALVNGTDKITSEISADPLTVAQKLMAKGLIPPVSLSSTLLQTKEKELKASELIKQVINKVGSFPENFEVFLTVLNEMPWLQQLAKWIHEEFIKIKDKKLETRKEVSYVAAI